MNKVPDVPYLAFEGELARSERHIKRLWITLVICVSINIFLTRSIKKCR